jgi:hypothetical protein
MNSQTKSNVLMYILCKENVAATTTTTVIRMHDNDRNIP